MLTVERMLGHWVTLLEGMVADDGRRVSVLPLLSEAQRAQVLVGFFAIDRLNLTVIEGESLLKHNFPAIHAVGRASHRAPRLIEIA